MPWIILVILVVWLFGASLLKVAFEAIVIVAAVIFAVAVASYIYNRRNRV